MEIGPGSTLGPYTIRAQLGKGGMGVVYTASDPRLKRQVAIKLLPPDLTRDETAKQRFLQEAQAASALDHPNICTIHEINEAADGQLYLVMAYYEGETLKERIERGPLALDEAVDIATQVGQGLSEAHGAGIVHRDIKPANLLLAKGGTVKILDFGLAKLAGTEGVTQTGTAVGTVAYMSPEQARGEEVDHRTDIWSLGVVLYEMLSGQQPFQGENLLMISDAIRSGDPTPLPAHASSLGGALNRALCKKVTVRYQAVADLLGDLTASTSTVTTASQPDVPSIAVLPFADMSPEKDQDYFCEGMAEELIDALARLEGLRVVARTSAFRFKGEAPDLREVGRTLNVKTVLEGSVRKAGKRLRINAQLINTADGYHLWSERYDRDMDDVFAVQDEIARTVVDRLKVTLLGADAPLVKRQTRSIDAYNLCLRGRFFHAKWSRHGFSQAVECFQLASAKDPDYPEPYADLANAYTNLSILGWSEPREIMPRVRLLAEKALALDNTVSVAHLALSRLLYQYDWDWSGAEREIRHAIDLTPRRAALRTAYAELLAVQGRAAEAAAEARRGLELGPLSLNSHAATAIVHWCAREYDNMLVRARRMLELEPTYFFANFVSGFAYGMKGQYQEAVTTLEEGRGNAQGDPMTEGALGWAYGLAGRREQARDLVRDVTHRRAEAYFPAACIAWIHVGLGELDEAIALLNKACEQREGMCAYFFAAPLYDPLRPDPRFQALLQKMNFPESADTSTRG